MNKIDLTNDQRVNLDYLHEQTRDGRVRDRIKAVLLRSEGWTIAMISQALRLHESTITRHINDYLEKEKLKPENGGSTSYLSNIQTEEVVQHLIKKHINALIKSLIIFLISTKYVLVFLD